jgi:hypothetical protein
MKRVRLERSRFRRLLEEICQLQVAPWYESSVAVRFAVDTIRI